MVNLIQLMQGGNDPARAAKISQELDQLEELMSRASICGLGQVVPVPIRSVAKYWPQELDEHRLHGRCQAGVCAASANSHFTPETGR
jgi:NADH:ubiquinone oxidoreductase subunit F (NADH-binding)